MNVERPQPLATVTLTLSIEDAIHKGYGPDDVALIYWWEDQKRIYRIYDEVQAELQERRECGADVDAYISGSTERSNDNRKNSTSTIDRQRFGLSVTEAAEHLEIEPATFRALLEHHLILELAPVGGEQRRRLLSDEAEHEGLGHNVFPIGRVGHLEGYQKSSPFAVLYEDRLDDVAWVIDWPDIQAGAAAQSTKRDKLTWLLNHHAYLPDAELARLSGYSVRSIERRRARYDNDNQPDEAAVAA